MGKNKPHLNPQSKKEMEIFKKNGETITSYLFVINDPTLTPSAKILFQYIYYDAARTGYCDVKKSLLAKATGISEYSVKAGIKAIKLKGWIKTEMVTICTGNKRRIHIDYSAIRKACPRKEQSLQLGQFTDFAKEKKNKINPNAIATYVLSKTHNQSGMSIKPVLFAKNLPPLSRMLFQLINSLEIFEGYCYAGNAFLEKKLGVCQSSVSDHLTILEEEKLLKITYGIKRKIFLEYDNLKKLYLKKESN